MRTRASLERYRFFLLRRVQTLATFGHEDEIRPLLGWYESQPLGRLVPLPARK
jgi:hypothetical protein